MKRQKDIQYFFAKKKPCQPVRESQSDGLHTVISEPGCSTGDILVQEDASVGQNSPVHLQPAVSRDETDDSDSDVEEMDTHHPTSEAESEVPLTSDTAPTGPDDHTYYMLHSTVNSSKTELLLTEFLGSDQPTRANYPFHNPLKINSTFPNPTGGVVPARLSSSASIPQLMYVGVATGLLSFFLFDWLSTSGLGQ